MTLSRGRIHQAIVSESFVQCIGVVEPHPTHPTLATAVHLKESDKTASDRNRNFANLFSMFPHFLLIDGFSSDCLLRGEVARVLEFPNAVVLNAVVRRMSAKERKRKSAKERKRAQKGGKKRKRALMRKNCKQPG